MRAKMNATKEMIANPASVIPMSPTWELSLSNILGEEALDSEMGGAIWGGGPGWEVIGKEEGSGLKDVLRSDRNSGLKETDCSGGDGWKEPDCSGGNCSLAWTPSVEDKLKANLAEKETAERETLRRLSSEGGDDGDENRIEYLFTGGCRVHIWSARWSQARHSLSFLMLKDFIF